MTFCAFSIIPLLKVRQVLFPSVLYINNNPVIEPLKKPVFKVRLLEEPT
jgi:hypothetical protein